MNQHRTSFLLDIHSLESLPTMNNRIHSTKMNINNAIIDILVYISQPNMLIDSIMKENRLHIILHIIAFFREILSQYFIITASTIVTKVSQIITYQVQSHIINGKINRSNGRVIVVGTTHRKRSFLLKI